MPDLTDLVELPDWPSVQVAKLFLAISEEIAKRLSESRYRIVITSNELRAILSIFPGRVRWGSYKLFPKDYGQAIEPGPLPIDVTNQQLIELSERIFTRFRDEAVLKDSAWQVWRILEEYRTFVITAILLSQCLEPKEIFSAEMPTRQVVFQLKEPDDSVFLAPVEGTFYLTPQSGEPPFVQVGDIVEMGQPICIIECNKTLNEIAGEERLEIVEIVAKHGELVEQDQVLFKVKHLDVDEQE